MTKAYLHNIKYALDNGYHLAVVCPEEGDYLQEPTTSYLLAKEGVESTGYAEILWLNPPYSEKAGEVVAVFVAQLGLEPDETIMDYGCNTLADEWANEYDKVIYIND